MFCLGGHEPEASGQVRLHPTPLITLFPIVIHGRLNYVINDIANSHFSCHVTVNQNVDVIMSSLLCLLPPNLPFLTGTMVPCWCSPPCSSVPPYSSPSPLVVLASYWPTVSTWDAEYFIAVASYTPSSPPHPTAHWCWPSPRCQWLPYLHSPSS